MNKYILFTIGAFLYFGKTVAQSNSLDELLKQIEQNNTELKAFQTYIAGRQFEQKSENNLPDPQLSGYYLAQGTHQPGNYTEVEISQSFEFPTVYIARSNYNNLRNTQLKIVNAKKRLEVLLKAKEEIINLYYLQLKVTIETERMKQGKKVYEHVHELFNSGQVGILDFNKAKIIWMQHQLTLDQLKNHIQNQQSKLQTLNGGKVLNVNQLQLPIPNQLLSAEVIWEEKLAKDPNFNEVLTDEATALQKVKLEKNKILPNLALGYNYQGIKGDNYAGVYGGLSIPIWNSKNKVKAAQANYEYQHYNVKRLKDLWQAEFQQGYNQYQLLFNNYTEYNATISQLNSEDLLFKAYTLGEFSFLEYFMEVQFYRNAVDKKVEIEQQIKLLQAQLLNHQL